MINDFFISHGPVPQFEIFLNFFFLWLIRIVLRRVEIVINIIVNLDTFAIIVHVGRSIFIRSVDIVSPEVQLTFSSLIFRQGFAFGALFFGSAIIGPTFGQF